MNGILLTVLALGFGLFGLVAFIMILVNNWVKKDNDIEKLRLEKETAELEIKKIEMKMKLLEKENREYDKIIYEDSKDTMARDEKG
jgi:beta-lactam-binding protein with PASTA domain